MKDAIILLVEDNPDDEALAIRAMQKNHLSSSVVVVRDGVEALEYLLGEADYNGRFPADLPAVILLDLNLPKIGGLEVLRRLRADERTRLIPVVVLSSSNADNDISTSYAYGANSFVRKPVDFNQFMDAVGRLSAYWLMINEQPGTLHQLPR